MESTPDTGWDADGWEDDDADWGSLEGDNKNTTTGNQNENQEKNINNEITKEEFDSWANGVLSNKVVPDKSAVVKQGIQTLQLVKNFF